MINLTRRDQVEMELVFLSDLDLGMGFYRVGESQGLGAVLSGTRAFKIEL